MARKNKKVVRHVRNGSDCHHIFYQRANWQRGTLASLRRHPYCMVYINRDILHASIHAKVGNVPTPKPINAAEAIRQLSYLEHYGAIDCEHDSIEKRLSVLISLFEVVEPKTTLALKRQLEIVHKYNNMPS